MKNSRSISKPSAGIGPRRHRLCWGGTLAVGLGLAAWAIFGWLRTARPGAYEQLSGSFPISLWLLVAAIAFAVLDYALGRSTQR